MPNTFIFDTETTGLCPRGIQPTIQNFYRWNGARIVQIAWEVYDDKQTLVSKKVFLIKPDDFVIPDSASKIHGITTEMAQKDGVPFHEVARELEDDLKDVSRLVAHNIDFDMSVLVAELFRANKTDLAYMLTSKEKVCTMKRGTRKYQKWPKLGELYHQVFQISPEEKYGALHRADVDVRCCADIYFHQENKKSEQ
jgi:DNA polymerase III subunit alpha